MRPKELSKSGKDEMIRGPDYLMPNACFECRKSWKRVEKGPGKCPSCGGLLYEMGRKFKVPKSRDKEQWEIIELLRKAGYSFWTSDYGGEPIPTKKTEVPSWIKQNPKHRLRDRRFWPLHD